jgi:hypothetical protein
MKAGDYIIINSMVDGWHRGRCVGVGDRVSLLDAQGLVVVFPLAT